jgi:hypothetical protein
MTNQVPCEASYTITLGNNSDLDLSVQNANIIIKKLAQAYHARG